MPATGEGKRAKVPPLKDCNPGLAHRWPSRDLIGGDESRELVTTGQGESEARGLRHLLQTVHF
uniref:Uncharacterized protein n=1 Tax=Peronospora matthiolae TaxID=2874970 RepID=A0AAV1TJP0_9STRA